MKIFGHEFAPMDDHDWMAFAGADDGSLICYCNDSTVLIYSPHGKTLSEFFETAEGSIERRWSLESDTKHAPIWGDPPGGA